MSQVQRITEVPIIGINPEGMVLLGTQYQFKLKDLEALRNFLEQTGLADMQAALIVLENPKERGKESPHNFYQTGVVAMTEVDEGSFAITFSGLYRAEIVGVEIKEGSKSSYSVAKLKTIGDENCDSYFVESQEELTINLKTIESMMLKFLRLSQGLYLSNSEQLTSIAGALKEADTFDKDRIDKLIWAVAFQVPGLSSPEKQMFIESTSLPERIGFCVKILGRMINVAENANKSSQPRANRTTARNQKQGGSASNIENQMLPEIAERRGRYEKIKDLISAEAQKAILEDFSRLNSCYPGQAEWETLVNHLDCLLALYSTETTPQENNISKVEKLLGQSHYGLEDIKERIYDHLATKIRNPNGKAPVLCLVGPPGVGKTSIGKSIAESLGLKFVRLSLGGIRDEAEIRGHRRTYIGSIPGKIVQEIIRLGAKNPVFMLDEVDKISNDFRGDPSSALLEVLDPEQNHSFQDHYVGAQFDLSGVLFVCTANTLSSIQPALLDRMEIIDIAGYTEFEKIRIAREFLVPKQVVETGFPGLKITWQDDDPEKVISKIVKGHTREAGVRELERQIHQIFSRWGRQTMKDGDSKPVEILITEELVERLLGQPKYTDERAKRTEVGEAIGLAWTPVGGDILYIQAELTPRGRVEKDISQTGGLLEVFKDANHNALTVAKNLLRNNKQARERLAENLLHLSVPDGGVKKDGPSAGITMTLAIYSELIDRPLKPFVAMSGEVTVKGKVRAVGGIKEKVLAAHRDGVREVILPVSNERDVRDKIPPEIKRVMKFHFVSNVAEVLPIVFPDNDPSPD